MDSEKYSEYEGMLCDCKTAIDTFINHPLLDESISTMWAECNGNFMFDFQKFIERLKALSQTIERIISTEKRVKTYGDYIRNMSDDQLAVLLDMVQFDGAKIAALDFYESVFDCVCAYDWAVLIKSERKDGKPRYAIM